MFQSTHSQHYFPDQNTKDEKDGLHMDLLSGNWELKEKLFKCSKQRSFQYYLRYCKDTINWYSLQNFKNFDNKCLWKDQGPHCSLEQ